jgi:hypothetical protein
LTGGETVSRIDLTVDFTVDANIEEFSRRSWVTRGSNRSAYAVGDQFSGLSFGAGGDISARLYDKQLEIASPSRKVYLFDRWLANGWNPLSTPWRLEFQLRRPALQRFGLRSPSEVPGARDTLWRYLTQDWLPLTQPAEGDQTRSRWPTVPFWSDLANVTWGGDAPRQPPPKPNGAPHDKWIARQFFSVLTSSMAKFRIMDFNDGVANLVELARGHWARRAEWEGAPIEETVAEAVRLKCWK